MPLEEKQVIELSKNVKQVVKILETAVGNTATQKAKQSKEEKIVDKKEELLKKEEDQLKAEEKAEEKKKISFLDVSSFIRSSAKDYFDKTDLNMVTWGGLGASIKEGVKNWFDEASQQRTMLGRTLRLGASMWRATHDHIIGAMRNIWGKVTGQLQEVLGEVGEVFGVVKDAFMSAFNFIKDSFMGFFKKVPPQDKKRNQYLQQMVGFMRRDEKRDLLGIGKGESELPGLIFGMALIAAALLGGMMKRFLAPFQIVAKILKIGPAIKAIKDWMLGIRGFANVIFRIKWNFIKFGRWVAMLWGKASTFFSFLPKMAGMFGKLFAFAKFGFKILGWPITIILGVIDFIRGFMGSEADTVTGKIMDGVKFMFEKFLELPVQFLGWLIEKILGLFGVEVEGVAGKIMDGIMWIIEAGFGWIKPIVGLIEGFIEGGPIEGIKRFFQGIQDMFMHLISVFPEPVQKMIIDFFVMIGDFFVMLWDKFKGLLDWFGIDMGPKGGEAIVNTTPSPKSDFSTMTDAEAKTEAEKQAAQSEAITTAIEESTDKQIEANKKIAQEQNDTATALAIGGNATAPAQTDDKQINDEIDQGVWGMFVGNVNG